MGSDHLGLPGRRGHGPVLDRAPHHPRGNGFLKRIAYLACADCLTTAQRRRPDAYEHDRELAALTPAFEARGWSLSEADWRACDPARFDLLLIRTTWDYVDHEAEFLAFLDRAVSLAPVANDPALVRWNLSKRYLQGLAAQGLPIIPSLFVDAPTPASAAFEAFGADEIILKPVVGGGGFGQSRLTRAEAEGVIIQPGQFAQPLVPEIMTTGEVSFIFVDGDYSHAVRKLPGGGDYRIHVIHGGGEHPYDPSPAEIETARTFVTALPVPALACRVDVIPTAHGLLLMELEAIEPHLFPTYGAQLGERMAHACGRLLA
ncbi:MAG: hypothetical protein KA085_17175 [Phenylobacterium sp.]|uniref:ATP-grasp domain-containing protein n=1 Tax=Phenylobacterium sp. TaxID=1871053 RepID=UPI001B44EA35|nr:hypothetical protein [Phenylobacterium sp.]MBP7817852.1 hypothetical protein [Phenylobacterium sp.]